MEPEVSKFLEVDRRRGACRRGRASAPRKRTRNASRFDPPPLQHSAISHCCSRVKRRQLLTPPVPSHTSTTANRRLFLLEFSCALSLSSPRHPERSRCGPSDVAQRVLFLPTSWLCSRGVVTSHWSASSLGAVLRIGVVYLRIGTAC